LLGFALYKLLKSLALILFIALFFHNIRRYYKNPQTETDFLFVYLTGHFLDVIFSYPYLYKKLIK